MWIYILVFIVFFLFWLFLLYHFSKKKHISNEQKSFLTKKLKKLNTLNSYREKIIESDKIYHKVLQAYWYNWTFGEILKQKPLVINDIQIIWDLHKLRNKLVHDFDLISESVLKKKAELYKKELQKLIK